LTNWYFKSSSLLLGWSGELFSNW